MVRRDDPPLRNQHIRQRLGVHSMLHDGLVQHHVRPGWRGTAKAARGRLGGVTAAGPVERDSKSAPGGGRRSRLLVTPACWIPLPPRSLETHLAARPPMVASQHQHILSSLHTSITDWI